MRDFSGCPAVKNPPSNAWDVGSIPGWGTKIPHDIGQISLHAAAREPVSHSYRKPIHLNKDPGQPKENKRTLKLESLPISIL